MHVSLQTLSTHTRVPYAQLPSSVEGPQGNVCPLVQFPVGGGSGGIVRPASTTAPASTTTGGGGGGVDARPPVPASGRRRPSMTVGGSFSVHDAPSRRVRTG